MLAEARGGGKKNKQLLKHGQKEMRDVMLQIPGRAGGGKIGNLDRHTVPFGLLRTGNQTVAFFPHSLLTLVQL